jgi:hypothetical protein
MIQRIQTVYLFLAACLMLFLVFVPFSLTSSTFLSGFYAGIFSLAAIVAIITIYFYKNRKLQIRLCYGMLLIQILVYVLFFIFDRQYLPLAEFFQQIRFTFVFPFIAGIFIFLAINGIKKDDKLVRSLDRLRS